MPEPTDPASTNFPAIGHSLVQAGLTEERLKEIEERHHFASEGPWGLSGRADLLDEVVGADMELLTSRDEGYFRCPWTARFVAHSWQDIKDLVVEVRSLRHSLSTATAKLAAAERERDEAAQKLDKFNIDRGHAWDALLNRPCIGRSSEDCWAQDGTLAMNIRHLCSDLSDMHKRWQEAEAHNAVLIADRDAAVAREASAVAALKEIAVILAKPRLLDGEGSMSWGEKISAIVKVVDSAIANASARPDAAKQEDSR